jgi:RNA polymerase sigma factor (sigma-70 family)
MRTQVHPESSPELSLEELMGLYVDGNVEAFDGLYRLVSPRLFGYLMQLTRNRTRAEDLLQVTFTKVHRARSTYLPGAPVLPWVMAIARRTFYDEVRAARVRREDLSLEGILPEPPVIREEPVNNCGGNETAGSPRLQSLARSARKDLSR